MNFPYEPSLIKIIDDKGFKAKINIPLGDVRQPWVDLGAACGISEFSAKAYFVLGTMRRYVLSANAILCQLKNLGFLSAYGSLSSAIEILGRCIHPKDEVRQHPERHSRERLSEGLGYIRDPLSKLSSDIVVGTNHYSYDVESLINLRNLSIHGSCIAAPGTIRGDIELLHELRKLIYGIPIGESNSLGKAGPISGAIDRYFEELKSGDKNRCDRLASAAISALHFLKLQNGDWPFAKTLINDLMQDIANNKSNGQPPISGSHTRQNDCFQLYK